ncbi:MAG: two-component system, OmpR family, sensor kinase, partial [Solirubrobacteraceae bacterium]|nr:two-component system, OmpR family, sensor kinase [Solirubrobacteraceae bacterium]
MSLRARLIVTLVVLAGVGLLVLGAATYAALSSYEVDRVDQQATAAVGQAQSEFEAAGIDDRSAGVPPLARRHDDHRPGGGPPGGIRFAPAGTFAQLRDASGTPVDSRVLALPPGETEPAAPKLPKDLHVGDRLTVGSVGSAGLRYRVYAAQSPGDPSHMTIVAVPFTDIEATLNRLLVIEALVIGGVLLALAAAAAWLVRLGLRPLDRIAATAGAIA